MGKIITDIEPRGKSVAILRVSLETKSGSGIIIPETTKEPRPTGIIVSCGPDCPSDIQEAVKTRRICMFNKYANLELTDGYNNTLLSMHEQDVQCWITEDTVCLDKSATVEKRIDIDQN